MELSFTATYENGVLKPPEPLPLANLAEVRVIVHTETPVGDAITSDEGPSSPTVAQRLKEFIGCLDGLPEDAARNHDHYLYGAPKQ